MRFLRQMRLIKHGITVDCEHCVYNSSDNRGAFEITVPIIDSETGVSGPATLRCIISQNRHRVELLEWNNVTHRPIQLIERLQDRVSATLSFVSDNQICGNRKICPSKVVQIVDENDNS